MITKERLEELIEEDAVIYWIFRGDILSVDLTLINRIYGGIALEYFDATYNCNLTGNLYDLYEHREDAEEEREFHYVSKVITIKFPMWKDLEKDFDKLENGTYTIAEYKHLFSMNLKISKPGTSQILLFTDDEKYNWNLSRENYNEARRLCVKLFRGEKNG